jgi:hypothetical protein
VLGTIRNPILILVGNIAQQIAAYRIGLAKVFEEIDHANGRLEVLDAGIEDDSIEAAILEIDVILVMLDEGVHGVPPIGLRDLLEGYTMGAFAVLIGLWHGGAPGCEILS